MKINELISQLQAYDGEKEIYVDDPCEEGEIVRITFDTELDTAFLETAYCLN